MLLAIDGTKEDAVTMMQRLHPWQIPVLVMSRHNDAKQVQRLLEAGARGYMLMRETPEMIVAAVRAVAGGEQWLNPHLGRLDEWPDWKRIGNQRTHGALSFGELLRQNGHLFSDRSRYLAAKEGIV